MKTAIQILLAAILFLAIPHQIHAQGTIDQESASAPVQIRGNGNADGFDLQQDSPLLQSFMPSDITIDFVSFEFFNELETGGQSATVYVNLYEGSSNIELDTLLGTSSSVYMANGFGSGSTAGVSTFDFLTPISLIPGDTYYLEPVLIPTGNEPWYIITIGNVVCPS